MKRWLRLLLTAISIIMYIISFAIIVYDIYVIASTVGVGSGFIIIAWLSIFIVSSYILFFTLGVAISLTIILVQDRKKNKRYY